MEIILDLIKSESLYPVWWLFFSWLIWLLLRWRKWPRPSMSIMLMYSASIWIFFVRSWQGLKACLKNPLCDPVLPVPFSLLPFLATVSFWLIVLYMPIALALKPKKLFDHKRFWWITFLFLSLAVWHLLSEESDSHFRTLIYIFRDLTYSDLISTNIYFYPAMGILVPLLIWLFLGVIEWPRPALPTAIIYLISLTNASTMLWIESYICKMTRNLCEVNISLPLFFGEIALWFIPLYALIKLISRVEFGSKLFELAEKRKGQLIGTEK